MEEQWINDLRKKMASHQTPVPPGLWESIEFALPSAQPARMPLAKKVLLWTSGIGSIAAAVALAFLFLDRDIPTSVPPSVALPQLAAAESPVATNSPTDRLLSEPLALTARSPKVSTKKAVAAIRQNAAEVGQTALLDEQSTPENTETNFAPIKRNSSEEQKADNRQSNVPSKAEKSAKSSRRSVSSPQRAQLMAAAALPRQQRWAVNLYAANLTHTSHHSRGYGEFVAGTALPQDFSTSQSPVKDLIYSNLGKEIETQKKHRFPLKFGISARYQLTPRFSLESGLTYTYLGSELTSGSADHHFVTEQRLQYLGIPLLVGYDLWKNHSWNFYLSGGGLVEKCIHGKSQTDYIISNQLVSSHDNSVMEKPLQCSLIGALGAQLHLSSHVGIYAEPGVSYYFDNGSPIETIYKDKPFNFNFKLGIRIHFN